MYVNMCPIPEMVAFSNVSRGHLRFAPANREAAILVSPPPPRCPSPSKLLVIIFCSSLITKYSNFPVSVQRWSSNSFPTPSSGLTRLAIVGFYEPHMLNRTNTAYRYLHSSKPVETSTPIPSSTTSATEPITALAQRGSNQFSLEHPQNKAGVFCFHTMK